jgi:hypothetical protein
VAPVCPASVGAAGVDCDISALAKRGLDGTLALSFTILWARDCRLWAREDETSTGEETAVVPPCVLLWTGEVSGASRKTLCTHSIATDTQREHGSFRSHFIFRRLHSRHENAGLRRRRSLSIVVVVELEEADEDGALLSAVRNLAEVKRRVASLGVGV